MKTTMKKIIPLLVISGTLMACSMHSYKPGPLSDLVGVYELEVYKKKHDPSDTDTYDYMAEIGAKAYFSIDKDGYGFYGYKDKKTAARVDQVFSTFEYNSTDEKHPEYIKSIDMNDGLTEKYAWEKAVGCLDESPLGFHDTALKKYLEYTIPYHKYTWYKPAKVQEYQYVQYKRIKEAGGLKEINKLLGTNVSFKKPFEMKGMNQFMIYHCSPNDGQPAKKFGIYDYVVLDTDSYSKGKVKLYYRVSESGVDSSVDVPVSITVKGKELKITMLGKEFNSVLATYQSLGTGYNYTAEDPYIYESFTGYRGQKTTLEEVIQECIDNPELV